MATQDKNFSIPDIVELDLSNVDKAGVHTYYVEVLDARSNDNLVKSTAFQIKFPEEGGGGGPVLVVDDFTLKKDLKIDGELDEFIDLNSDGDDLLRFYTKEDQSIINPISGIFTITKRVEVEENVFVDQLVATFDVEYVKLSNPDRPAFKITNVAIEENQPDLTFNVTTSNLNPEVGPVEIRPDTYLEVEVGSANAVKFSISIITTTRTVTTNTVPNLVYDIDSAPDDEEIPSLSTTLARIDVEPFLDNLIIKNWDELSSPASYDLSILNQDDWYVRSQSPNPGTELSQNDSLTIGIDTIPVDDSGGGGEYTPPDDAYTFDDAVLDFLVASSIDDAYDTIQTPDEIESDIITLNLTEFENERLLQYTIFGERGNSYLTTNYVDGGTINQIDDEINALGSIVIKSYERLDDLSLKDEVIYYKNVADTLVLEIDLTEEIQEEDPTVLRPNFAFRSVSSGKRADQYKSFNDLTLSGTSAESKIIEYFFQKQDSRVKLNVDYTNFNNFVKFSSAEERLINFRYKIQEIEDLITKQSQATSAESARINDEILDIKSRFDDYEKFLFNGDEGVYEELPFVDSSQNIKPYWPKSGNTLVDSNSIEGKLWFESITNIAREYDLRNIDSLRNNTPKFIVDDDKNEDYILFLSMIGQLFDEIWLYSKELGNQFDWNNDINKGLSEDLSLVLLNAFGSSLDVGFSDKDIWEYILGTDSSDNGLSAGVRFSFEKRQKETIRRLLANLPLLLQTRGTEQSVRSLVTSYGVPLSTLAIKEYGRNLLESDSTLTTRDQSRYCIKFSDGITLSLTDSSLNGTKAVQTTLSYQGVPATTSSFFSMTDGSGDIILSIVPTGSSGYVHFEFDREGYNFEATSSVLDVFNGDRPSDNINIVFQQVQTGTFDIHVQQFNQNTEEIDFEYKMTAAVAESEWPSADALMDGVSSFIFGDDNFKLNFNGILDSLRIWKTPLAVDVIRDATRYPSSYRLTDPLQIPNSLVVNVENFAQDEFRNNFTEIPNRTFNPLYATEVFVNGLSSDNLITKIIKTVQFSPKIGLNVLDNNKVRYSIRQNLASNRLTPNFGDGSSISNLSFPDYKDSNNLVIGFSPTDIANDIILSAFGSTDLQDIYGDTTSKYEDTYRSVSSYLDAFFSNRKENDNKTLAFLIQYIRNFDKTLFENIKRFVPHKAKLTTALFIEPNLLARSKGSRLGRSATADLANRANPIGDTYIIDGDQSRFTGDSISGGGTGGGSTSAYITSIVNDFEALIAEYISIVDSTETNRIISGDEILDSLQAETAIIVISDGFLQQAIQNNMWDENGIIKVRNGQGELFSFKVYKFDYTELILNLEQQLALLEDGSEDYLYTAERRRELIRLDGQLVLIKADIDPADLPANLVEVDYSDVVVEPDPDGGGGSGGGGGGGDGDGDGDGDDENENSDDGTPPVVTIRVQDTRTIVTDPDDDIKLTVF